MAWLASTAFISYRTESQINETLITLNEFYKTYYMKIRMTEYKPGFFESKATFVSEFTQDTPPPILEIAKKMYQVPLKTEAQIEHGPLFFKHGLGLGLAKFYYKLSLKELLNPEFWSADSLKNNIVIDSETMITFTKKAVFTSNMNAVDYTDKASGLSIKLSPLVASGEIDMDDFTGNFKTNIDHFSMQEKNKNLTLTGIKMDGVLKGYIVNHFLLYDYDISMAQVKIDAPEYPPLDIAMKIKVNMDKTSDQNINILFSNEIDTKKTQFPNLPPFKNFKGQFTLNHIPPQVLDGLNQFNQELTEMQMKAINELTAATTDKEREKALLKLEEMQGYIKTKGYHLLKQFLVNEKTMMGVALTIEDNENKQNTAEVQLAYSGFPLVDSVEQFIQQLPENALKLFNLDAQINLNKKWLSFIPATSKKMEILSKRGFIQDNPSSYSAKLHYKKEKLMLNNEDISAQVLPFAKIFIQKKLQ